VQLLGTSQVGAPLFVGSSLQWGRATHSGIVFRRAARWPPSFTRQRLSSHYKSYVETARAGLGFGLRGRAWLGGPACQAAGEIVALKRRVLDSLTPNILGEVS
jgi:hypothetical protein